MIPWPFLLQEEVEHETAGDDRGDLSGDVDADGVHQEEVFGILLASHVVDDTT